MRQEQFVALHEAEWRAFEHWLETRADVRPVLAGFFAEHARCDTYVDLSRAGRSVSRVLLVPPQRTAERTERRVRRAAWTDLGEGVLRLEKGQYLNITAERAGQLEWEK